MDFRLRTMEVHVNNRNHLGEFIRLNEEWIRRYFILEETDRALARDPGAIIDQDGFVFSIVEDGTVVGVCALFKKADGVYELARMAVPETEQGKGYGNLLMQACLEKLRALRARRVYLVSNTKLTAAIAMYRKFGFVPTGASEHPGYARANIVMERLLQHDEQAGRS